MVDRPSFSLLIHPGVWQQSIEVSLSACLSAHIHQESHVQTLPNFRSVLLAVAARSSSGGVAIRYVILPVLKMMSCLTITDQAKATQ